MNNTYEGIDPQLVKIVRKAAKRAIGKAGFTRNDLPDIEQELMLAALNGLKQDRNSIENETAFTWGVVNNHLKLLFRKENHKSKRWRRHRISLNIPIELDSGDLEELIDLVDADYLLRNHSYCIPDPYCDIDLAENIDTHIRTLPEELRRLCEELKKQSVKELTREKKTRITVTRREIKQIRKELKKLETLLFFRD